MNVSIIMVTSALYICKVGGGLTKVKEALDGTSPRTSESSDGRFIILNSSNIGINGYLTSSLFHIVSFDNCGSSDSPGHLAREVGLGTQGHHAVANGALNSSRPPMPMTEAPQISVLKDAARGLDDPNYHLALSLTLLLALCATAT